MLLNVERLAGRRFRYYLDALSNAPYCAGVVYLARVLKRDPFLDASDRLYLLRFADSCCFNLSGVHLDSFL